MPGAPPPSWWSPFHLLPPNWLADLVGPALVAETVKSLHCLIAVSSVACCVAYLRPVVRDVRTNPMVARFLVWTLMISASQVPCFLPLLASYVLLGTDPAPVPGLPDEWRLLYLAMEHTALAGRWAEARPERFLVRLVAASALSFAGAVVVFRFLPFRG